MLPGSVAAVLGLMKGKNRNSLVHLNPFQMKTMTPRFCTLWPALRGSSSRWETVSTCLPMLSTLGEYKENCQLAQTCMTKKMYETHLLCHQLSV